MTAPFPGTGDLADDPGFALYVHWPFCVKKCPYCDFNSHVADGAVDDARWRRALLGELDHFAAETRGRRLTSIFFGGGTPSLMDPATVAAMIEAATQAWVPAGDLEVTLEANPSSSEAGRFRDYRAAGVNRLSLGVQAFDDTSLAGLGRVHGADEARAAIAAAAATFDRFSFDLIYARPGQDVAAWRAELSEALTRAGSHLSLYQLTIEPGTAFFREGRAAADEDLAADLYETTQEVLEAHGLPAYEVSNHARPGEQARHNLVYWRGGDYVGIGPGAHGRLTAGRGTAATHQIHGPAAWLAAVEKAGHGTAKRRPLGPWERAEEVLMTGLRLAEGISRPRFRRATGLDLDDVIEPRMARALMHEGYLGDDGTTLATTPAGRMRLGALTAALLRDGPD